MFYCIRNPNPPSPRQPVSISNIFKFHSPFCFFPKKTTFTCWNGCTVHQHLHTLVHLHYSSFIVLWSNFPLNTWFDSIITGLPRPVMSSCSTFPLHNFFRILLLMALLFFWSRPCTIKTTKQQIIGEKTRPNPQNSLISDPIDKDLISLMKIHWYNLFFIKKRFLKSTGKTYILYI